MIKWVYLIASMVQFLQIIVIDYINKLKNVPSTDHLSIDVEKPQEIRLQFLNLFLETNSSKVAILYF